MGARDHSRSDRAGESARGPGGDEQAQLIDGQRHVADRAQQKAQGIELLGEMLAEMDHHAKLPLAAAEVVRGIVGAGPAAFFPRKEFRPEMVEALELRELVALGIRDRQAWLMPDL